MINPTVLEETPNDTDHANVFAEARDFRTQTANTTHNEIDGHIRARGLVKFFDDFLVNERIHLRDNARRFIGPGMVSFALDQSDQPFLHIERRDHQLLQTGISGEAGERVKHDADFLSQLRFGGEETPIGIGARSPRIVISRAEMDIMANAIGIAADDQKHFAMRLQADYAIDAMRASLFKSSNPSNV